MKDNKPLALGSDSLRTVITAVAVIVFSIVLSHLIPDYSTSESYGFFSVIPAVFLIVYIFITKRIFEALILSSFMGYILLGPKASVTEFSSSLLNVMMSDSIAFLIIVCGLMGSIIAMVEKTGGAWAFDLNPKKVTLL